MAEGKTLAQGLHSPWKSKLLPSAQPEWLRRVKEVLLRKKSTSFANSVSVFSPLRGYGREALVCFSRLGLLAPRSHPQDQARALGPTTLLPPSRAVRHAPVGCHTDWNMTSWGLPRTMFFCSPLNTNSYTSETLREATHAKLSRCWNNDPWDVPSLVPKFLTWLSLQLTR